MLALTLAFIGGIGLVTPDPALLCPDAAASPERPFRNIPASRSAWVAVHEDPAAAAPVDRAVDCPAAHVAAAAQSRSGGDWLGEDKLAHAAVSFALATTLHASARAVGVAREPAVALGGIGAALAGVAKEWRDWRAGGRFEAGDLAWDVLGIAAGMFLVSHVR